MKPLFLYRFVYKLCCYCLFLFQRSILIIFDTKSIRLYHFVVWIRSENSVAAGTKIQNTTKNKCSAIHYKALQNIDWCHFFVCLHRLSFIVQRMRHQLKKKISQRQGKNTIITTKWSMCTIVHVQCQHKYDKLIYGMMGLYRYFSAAVAMPVAREIDNDHYKMKFQKNYAKPNDKNLKEEKIIMKFKSKLICVWYAYLFDYSVLISYTISIKRTHKWSKTVFSLVSIYCVRTIC